MLEKAELSAKFSDAERHCIAVELTDLADLNMDGVRDELSRSLKLKHIENERLRRECRDVEKLRAYAATESKRPSGAPEQEQSPPPPPLPPPANSTSPHVLAVSPPDRYAAHP